MKRLTFISFMVCLVFQGCKISDVRPEHSAALSKNEDKLKSICSKVETTYGGYEKWKKTGAVTVRGYDEWPTFHWRLIANPWKDKKTSFSFTWAPNTDNSRITLLDGKKTGMQYGLQYWATYQKKKDKIVFKRNKKMWFHLPTIEYFLEFPFRIREAEIVRYAGTRKVNNLAYEMLFFTWKSEEPNKAMDQYLVYVNPETYRIDYLELTVRDQAKWAYATVTYGHFVRKNGFLFPGDIRFFFQNKLPGKTLGHHISLSEIQVHQRFDRNTLIPDSTMRRSKF
ncbi:hypothetical protein QQ020_25670 [Fulvivirgaceae bacterium BMA12]|uniref:Uncharacterized protein n=1 Tax=Agaribacillus aureus TaxID=3051825 RepID=A0ABT8LCK5_9BACT|nr:hypothetical protein [Fulvivirgaceae bacterium BMA12]